MWFLPFLLAAAPAVTPEEDAALSRREVVVRIDEQGTGASMVALVRVKAPPERVLAAAMDVERLARLDNVASVDVYRREADLVGARIVAKAVGMTWTYHLIYRADPARMRVTYTLDPSRPNDFSRLEGSYELLPADGGTLVVNRASGESGGWVPEVVRRWTVAKGMREKLEVIRDTAEAR